MFTGIVERTGKVVSMNSAPMGDSSESISQLILDAGRDFATNLGDSVAVNGCCLTVTSNKLSLLAFDVGHQTLNLTNLSELEEGEEVNLERAATLETRLGGHLVTGHIDGTGRVIDLVRQSNGWDLTVSVPHELSKYIVHKGSICLNGVSLTVATLEDFDDYTKCGFMLIPTTLAMTNLKTVQTDSILNIEVDIVAKHLERLEKFS